MGVSEQTASTSPPSPVREWLQDTLEFALRPQGVLRDSRHNLLDEKSSASHIQQPEVDKTFLGGHTARLGHSIFGALRPDMLAGLTVAIVMLPQAMAYALIAELPPQIGIYSAVIASVVAILWGSSIYLHTGPTNAASLLVLSTLLTVAEPGSPEYIAAAGVMAVLVGIIRLAMGLARLGVLVNFVADSVVIGFTAGAGILIAVNQLQHLLGLNLPSSPLFLDALSMVVQNLDKVHWPSAFISIGTIGLMLTIQLVRPKWPNALIGMIMAAAVVGFNGLDQLDVVVLGELPSGLPPLTDLLSVDFNLVRQLLMGAVAISLIGLVEAMSIARSISARSGERLDSNQEFVGQGLANIVAGLFSGYTCSGSFTRTAVNYESGARTQLAVIFSAIFVVVAMFFLAPWAAYLPRAALSGLLIITAYKLIDRKEMVRIWQTSRGDSMIMFATLLATLFLPLEFAVLTGVLVSFGRFLAKTSTPSVYTMLPDDKFEHFAHQPDKPDCPQLGLLTITGSIYFGATQHVEEEIRNHMARFPDQRYLLLRMGQVNHCDISAIHLLESMVRLYRQRSGDIFMMNVRRGVWEKMKLSEFDQMLGEDHFLTQENAIDHIFYHTLDPAQCIYRCQIRAWKECQTLPKSDKLDHVVLKSFSLAKVTVKSISPKKAWARLNEDDEDKPLMIDVREPTEYANGHVPYVRSMPMSDLVTRPLDLPNDQDIVLICRSGRRSTQVAQMLHERGYHSISNVVGGMNAWQAAGLPQLVE